MAYISRAVPSTAQKTTAQTTETRSEQTQNGAHMRRVARAAHRGEGRRQATRQLTPVQGICMRQAPSQSCVCDIRTCRVWLIAPVVVAILNSESPTSRHSQVTSSATCAILALVVAGCKKNRANVSAHVPPARCYAKSARTDGTRAKARVK